MNNYAFRVTRGSGWFDDVATYLAARARRRYAPSNRGHANGFRCVRVKFSGSSRVIRGGSWDDGAASCRATSRCGGDPARRVSYVGLRVVRRDA